MHMGVKGETDHKRWLRRQRCQRFVLVDIHAASIRDLWSPMDDVAWHSEEDGEEGLSVAIENNDMVEGEGQESRHHQHALDQGDYERCGWGKFPGEWAQLLRGNDRLGEEEWPYLSPVLCSCSRLFSARLAWAITMASNAGSRDVWVFLR